MRREHFGLCNLVARYRIISRGLLHGVHIIICGYLNSGKGIKILRVYRMLIHYFTFTKTFIRRKTLVYVILIARYQTISTGLLEVVHIVFWGEHNFCWGYQSFGVDGVLIHIFVFINTFIRREHVRLCNLVARYRTILTGFLQVVHLVLWG